MVGQTDPKVTQLKLLLLPAQAKGAVINNLLLTDTMLKQIDQGG